jgi:heme-degrading monooxygenase HmoA
MEEEVRLAFRSRPHVVDQAPGFQRMDVLRPLGRPEEFWLMTWWTDEQSFIDWHRSHCYHACHAGIPRGLKLVPGSVEIHRLERIAD